MTTQEQIIDDGGIDDFINESKGGSGGKGNYLKPWNKNQSQVPARGRIAVWLHPRSKILKRWSHPFYRVTTFKEKQQVRMTRFNSMESGQVCTKQYYLDDEGNREAPPVICPFALTLEWVRQQIQSGKIDWCDEIFRIDAEDIPDDERVVIHAGGWTGLFDSRDVRNDKLKIAEISKKAKVRQKDYFKSKGLAQMQWLLSVVDDAKPEEGCKLATESKEVGSKCGEAIESRRRQLNNPTWSPINATSKSGVVIEGEPTLFDLEHDGSADPGKKYRVTIMIDTEPSEEVEAVFAQDPPDVTEILGQSNVAQLRQWFEEYWVHRVTPPWDKLFEAAMERVKGTPAAQLPDDFDPDQMGGRESKTKVEEDDRFVACDACEKPMPSDATTCPNCGREYDFNPRTGEYTLKPEKPKEETPAPRLPRRSGK